MKPYNKHETFKGCYYEQCGSDIRSTSKTARQKAKKEIRDEFSKVDKKSDMYSWDS